MAKCGDFPQLLFMIPAEVSLPHTSQEGRDWIALLMSARQLSLIPYSLNVPTSCQAVCPLSLLIRMSTACLLCHLIHSYPLPFLPFLSCRYSCLLVAQEISEILPKWEKEIYLLVIRERVLFELSSQCFDLSCHNSGSFSFMLMERWYSGSPI